MKTVILCCVSKTLLLISCSPFLYAHINDYDHEYIQKIAENYLHIPQTQEQPASQSYTRPLFQAYPALYTTLAHLNLGALPTPITRLQSIEHDFLGLTLYLKDDSITGKQIMGSQYLFGGNKVRKLEFLLADVLKHGAESVITFGGAGSNHATATAIYAQLLGLKATLLLHHQPNADIVQRNIRFMHDTDAYIDVQQEQMSDDLFDQYVDRLCKEHCSQKGTIPYIIPSGGSSSIGIVGFVNAAFELKEQIDAGILPEPDYIYVPYGTGGTMVGLMIGLKALGLKTKVIGVVVAPVKDPECIYKRITFLFNNTVQLLQERSNNTFPSLSIDYEEILLNFACGAPCYGSSDAECLDAVTYFLKRENIVLDGTYTGKAAVGFLRDSQDLADNKAVVLFWNTFFGQKRVDTPVIISDQLQDYFS